MESMGLSVEASGRYGLFSAEGKFELANQSSFNSQSTFVVANSRVKNAFEQVKRAALLPEAKPLKANLEKGNAGRQRLAGHSRSSASRFWAHLRNGLRRGEREENLKWQDRTP
jgi:hypothetical protein